MLKDQLLAPGRRPLVVDDCVCLLDEQVAGKSGLGGIAVKGAYAVVKAVKPGFVREAVDHLLDEFVARLEPFHAAAREEGDVQRYFTRHADEVADALLAVTDTRARRAGNPTAKKAYDRLRPSAQKHVGAAVPGIARLLEKHAATAAA